MSYCISHNVISLLLMALIFSGCTEAIPETTVFRNAQMDQRLASRLPNECRLSSKEFYPTPFAFTVAAAGLLPRSTLPLPEQASLVLDQLKNANADAQLEAYAQYVLSYSGVTGISPKVMLERLRAASISCELAMMDVLRADVANASRSNTRFIQTVDGPVDRRNFVKNKVQLLNSRTESLRIKNAYFELVARRLPTAKAGGPAGPIMQRTPTPPKQTVPSINKTIEKERSKNRDLIEEQQRIDPCVFSSDPRCWT